MASVFRYEVVEREKARAAVQARTSQIPMPVRASSQPPAAPRPSVKPSIDVAGTQELQADDILEMAESLASAPSPEVTAPATVYVAPPSVAPPAPVQVVAAQVAPPVHVAPPPPVYAAPLPHVSAPPRNAPLSVAPVEMDVPADFDLPPIPRPSRADSTLQIDWRPPRVPKRKLGFVVAGAVFLSVCILAAGVARRVMASEEDSNAALAAMVTPPRPSQAVKPPALPKPAPAAPSADVAASVSQVGTIIGPAGRIYLDGKGLRGSSAIVPCGKHSVRIAPARKPHDVDVPCGGEIKVR